MREVILYSAASLDNFIARPDGGIDWLHYPEYEVPGEDYGYHDFYNTIDTTLMGNNTYKMVLGFDVPFPYPEKTNYVFTHSQEYKNTEYVSFISEDIAGFVKELKTKPGKDIWLVGGGQINTLLLNNDLIDKMILTLIPIILGEGIQLFNGVAKEVKFDLVESKSYKSGLAQLTFKRKQ